MARYKTYTQFLNSLKAKLSLDEIRTDEIAWINDSLNTRYEKARKCFQWPDVTLIEERTPVNNVIAWAQAGENEIEKVWNVYNKNPEGTESYYGLPFKPQSTGILIQEPGFTTVWIEYTPAFDFLDATAIQSLQIEDVLFEYCIFGGVADYHSARGADDKAAIAESKASMAIASAKREVLVDQKQTASVNVTNHINSNVRQ